MLVPPRNGIPSSTLPAWARDSRRFQTPTREAEATRGPGDMVGVKSLIKAEASLAPDQVKDTRACSKSDVGAIYLGQLPKRAADWPRAWGGGELSRPTSP